MSKQSPAARTRSRESVKRAAPAQPPSAGHVALVKRAMEYFPVDVPVAERGIFGVNLGISLHARWELATCLLEGVWGILSDNTVSGGSANPAACLGLPA